MGASAAALFVVWRYLGMKDKRPEPFSLERRVPECGLIIWKEKINFDLTDEQKMIREISKDLADEIIAPRAEEMERAGE